MSDTRPLLTLVIPAYNEEERLPVTLPKVIDFVSQQPYATEVILVNNNSKDRTRAIADEFAAELPFFRVLDEPTQGKGAAVRSGVLAARGEYIFLADADFSMPVAEINKFLPPHLGDYDVAIGSREVEGAVRYDEPEYRHIMGRVFNLIVRLIAVPGFQDTQAGFKCFRRQAALNVFADQTIDGWAFDVEVLFIALQRHLKIVEVPIAWHYMANSRISPLRDAFNMVVQVLKIRWNGLRGLYDQTHSPA